MLSFLSEAFSLAELACVVLIAVLLPFVCLLPLLAEGRAFFKKALLFFLIEPVSVAHVLFWRRLGVLFFCSKTKTCPWATVAVDPVVAVATFHSLSLSVFPSPTHTHSRLLGD